MSESTVNQQSRSPTHVEQQQQPSSPASRGTVSSTQQETDVVGSQHKQSLPNGLQKADAVDATMSSDLADDDVDASQ